MGERISISFVKGSEESVVLFSHWGGPEFEREAREYVARLKEWAGGRTGKPLERLEPGTVLVDFIRQETAKLERVVSDLYLGATEHDGDNSDNGHHIISLDE